VQSLTSALLHLFHPRRSNNHRPRVLHPEAFVYYILIVIGFVGIIHSWKFLPEKMGHVLGFASNITAEQVVDHTNTERAKQGLPPLTVNSDLSAAALSKGQDMFNDQYWAHTAPDGTEPWYFIKNAGYHYRAASENLARDFSDTPGMVKAWMASPTHRANILNAKYQEIGIAVIDGKLEGYDTTLVVQMFGSPVSAAPQLTDAQTTYQPVAEAAPEIFATDVPVPAVLASSLVPTGTLDLPPLFSPLELTKAFFLALILLLVMTLVYDAFVINNSNTIRLVGKNLGHIIYFIFVAFWYSFSREGS